MDVGWFFIVLMGAVPIFAVVMHMLFGESSNFDHYND